MMRFMSGWMWSETAPALAPALVGAELARDGGLTADQPLAGVHRSTVGAGLARDGGLTADRSLADVHRSTVGAGLARDGGLTADQPLAGVHIHSCGNGHLGFRPDGDSLWQTPQRKQRSSPQAYGTSPRLGVPSLRCPSGGIAYGLLRDDLLSMCPAAPYGAARPPPDEHLRSAFR